MTEPGAPPILPPPPPTPPKREGDPRVGVPDAEVLAWPTSPPCIWISVSSAGPVEPIGRGVQRQLLERRVPAELVCVDPVEWADRCAGARADPDLIGYLADMAAAMASRDRTVVVAGPSLDSEATRTVRHRLTGLIRVLLEPAGTDGSPPPIPTIYWFVEGPHIQEATIPAATYPLESPRSGPNPESDDRADVVVSGVPRPPGVLAGDIVDALFRAGWLSAPLGPGVEPGRLSPGSGPEGAPAPGQLLAVGTAR